MSSCGGSGLQHASSSGVVIRRALEDDCEAIFNLFGELAEINAPPNAVNPIHITADILRRDGFGDNPLFHCFVADDGVSQGQSKAYLVGYAMYFFAYAAWYGASVHLEDFFVKTAYRQKGIGSALWKAVIDDGLKRGCTTLSWVSADTYKESLDYYRRRGGEDVTLTENWHLFRMDKPEMENFAQTIASRDK